MARPVFSLYVQAVVSLAAMCLLAILPFSASAADPVAADIGRTQLVMLEEPRVLPSGASVVWFAWGGGDWNQLTARLQLHDCGLQALWLEDRGWSWHAGLPKTFNREFESEFGAGQTISAGELAAVCASEGSRWRRESSWPDLGLGETQVRWLLRPPHDPARNKQGQALIQYGGGSFYQLVSRLSTQGCNVHTLSIHNTHYSFQNTNKQNKEFTDNYKDYIPKDTNIHISCIDNCDVIYGLDLVENPEDREFILNVEKCDDDVSLLNEFFTEIYGTNLDSYTECTDNWSEGARQFFSMAPVFQNICKIEVFLSEGYGGGFLEKV